jgi:hypothetical protein
MFRSVVSMMQCEKRYMFRSVVCECVQIFPSGLFYMDMFTSIHAQDTSLKIKPKNLGRKFSGG